MILVEIFAAGIGHVRRMAEAPDVQALDETIMPVVSAHLARLDFALRAGAMQGNWQWREELQRDDVHDAMFRQGR